MTSCELKRWSSDFPPSKTRVAHTRNFPPKERDLVLSCARAIVTFHIGLHEMCVRTGVLYVITKFSEEDSLPNFLTHGAPLRARFARARSSAMKAISHGLLGRKQMKNITNGRNRGGVCLS